jgi:hypothetical protein
MLGALISVLQTVCSTSWGGIPRYWELAERFGDDLAGAVDALVLDPTGPLHGEPSHLLIEERPPAGSLRSLLDAIGSGAHRVSEIAGRIGQPASSLARPLTRLIDLDLVRRQIPFGESERSSKRALYDIADPFFRFWFRAVAPHRGMLAEGRANNRRELWERVAPSLFADIWEELCRQPVVAGRGQMAVGPRERSDTRASAPGACAEGPAGHGANSRPRGCARRFRAQALVRAQARDEAVLDLRRRGCARCCAMSRY